MSDKMAILQTSVSTNENIWISIQISFTYSVGIIDDKSDDKSPFVHLLALPNPTTPYLTSTCSYFRHCSNIATWNGIGQ